MLLLIQVCSAQQVLSMFVNSERIHHDIGSALKYGQAAFAQNVVVRKWVPIDVDMEFRGFVFAGKLTALSQYNHIVFFERLAQFKQALLSKIVTFFEAKVAPQLKKKAYEGYIVDFAVTLRDGELADVW